jgi:AcrR family transcriptional regulator
MESSGAKLRAYAGSRRLPVQRRSRERVEQILLAAEQLVVTEGVDALTTREAAKRAGIPVATLYQYFADRGDIISALIERHIMSMDERIGAALLRLEVFSVRTIVEATIAAYREAYRDHPSHVVLWYQGRVSPAVAAMIRARNDQLAARFFSFTSAAGLTDQDADPRVLRLAYDVADRILEVAYRHDLSGDDRVVAEGVEMLVSYLERYATPAGILGINASDLRSTWENLGR